MPLLLFLLPTMVGAPGRLTPVDLECEYARNPLGMDAARPRLSWRLVGEGRARRQTAYRVTVASSAERLASGDHDLWDSGKVLSDNQTGVEYAGAPLASGHRAFWRVQVWDENRESSAQSEVAWWEAGVRGADGWQAEWIRSPRPGPADEAAMYEDDPAPLFRTEFEVRGPVRRARAYVTGLGYSELRLNGERVGRSVLDPAWTSYARRVFYSTYDITDKVRQGPNAVGALVGNGWYNPLPLAMWGWVRLREHLTIGRPRLLAQIEIEYEDGARETVATGPSWRVTDGPIVRNSVYLGETYDARLEQDGWDRPGFDDSGWRRAVLSEEPVGRLEAMPLPPIREHETLQPVAVAERDGGARIVDFGRNFAGWVRLRVRGEGGETVTLRYGELLNPDGSLNPMTSVAGQIKGPGVGGPGAPDVAWQQDTYVCRGGGEEEVWEPRFTFHGFRYVELTGPAGARVEGVPLWTDVPSVGEFECSNPLLNDIQAMCRNTLLSNLFSVQSDCPHREKFGYGGDIVATSEYAMANFDMHRFYAKTVRDLADAVRPNGGFTETAPFVGIADGGFGEGSGPIGWGIAHPTLVWQLYQRYGDRSLLEEQYAAVVRWVDLLESKAREGIIAAGIGDHESLAPKSVGTSGTAFHYESVRLAGRMAAALGRDADHERFERLAAEIADAYNRAFVNPETGAYDTGTQACQAFSLGMGLVPPEREEAALGVLVADLASLSPPRLTTGIFGTKYLLETLTEHDRADLAYALVNHREFPGWGHMLAGGATTLWEHWEFSDNTFSHNHPMFGSVSEWFFECLAGIQPDEGAIGYDRIVLKPHVVGDLTWVRASHESIRGPIRSTWRIEGEKLLLEASIPPNATATIYVPTSDPSSVMESGVSAERADGLRALEPEPGYAVFEAGSGEYRFESEWTP